ncbi:MAG: GAF domain-containing protein [Candidatus Tectomicrobia bacterium]|uniref:GAF domain-containing protein n=1 Tax=Tectimicrobiota bacterium TaxID=2528274 RepID=A0A932I314_UNCTE|nr:GAF domain-containing protein [Candidatus Tectomicrobia bacterium]
MPQTKVLLQELVDLGVRVVESRYGALGVLTGLGEAFADFLTAGIDLKSRLAIGANPLGVGLMGVILRDPRPLRVPDIGQDPRAVGFPPHHPRMRSFLGVPIRAGWKVRGGLYFTGKESLPEFRPEDERLAECLARLAAEILDGKMGHTAVQRSLKYLRDGVDGEGEAVVIMGPGREIIRWSGGARALFGFTADEALGRRFVDLLVPPEDRERWRRQFEPHLMRELSEGKVYRANVTRLHKSGRRLPVRITLSPILHEMAGVKTIVGVYKFKKE